MKRKILFLLVAILLFTLPVNSFAQTDSTINFENDLIKGLKLCSSQSEYETVIKEVCKKYENEVKENIEKKEIQSSSEVIKKKPVRIVKINDDSDLILRDSYTFGISTLTKETPTQSEILAIDNKEFSTKSAQSTGLLTHSYTAYGSVFGNKLFSVYTRGEFLYDGDTVTAQLDDSWYKRYFGCVWQVSNWEEDEFNSLSGTYSKFYGRGNFHWGAEYQGVGLVIDDVYIDVYIECDEDGNYSKRYSIIYQ